MRKTNKNIRNANESRKGEKAIKENKQALTLKKDKIKKHPKAEKYSKININEKKIKSLLGVGHIEELFYLLGILKEQDINTFIKHYKEHKIKSHDAKVDRIISNAKDKNELMDLLKKELIELLNGEYERLKQEISSERKKGVDVYIEDIHAMFIPLKIRMFSATSKKEDYYKTKKMIREIEENLKAKKMH